MQLRWFRFFNALQASALLPQAVRRLLRRAMGLKIHPTAYIGEGGWIGSDKVEIGARAYLNIGCILDGSERLIIDEDVSIGQAVTILTGTHEIGGRDHRAAGAVNQPVHIQKGAWIGARTVILPGVVVARGCVIGAGCVLTKSTEPDGLYLGSPGRRVRDLPSD